MLHSVEKTQKTITDADKQQIERIMAKGDSLSEAHTALTLEIIKKFKTLNILRNILLTHIQVSLTTN